MKTHLFRSTALCASVIVLLGACSTTPKVHTQANASTDYSRYRTFTLLPLAVSSPVRDPGLMLRLAEPARQAANEALAAKRFTATNFAQADIAVNLRGSSLPKVEVTDWGYNRTVYTRRYGHVPVHVGEVDIRTTEERTLTVEIFDNRTKELVWVGWCKRNATDQVKVEKVQEAIHAILGQFPPASTPSAAR